MFVNHHQIALLVLAGSTSPGVQVHLPKQVSKPSFRHQVRQLQNNSIAAIGLCGLLCLVKPSIHVAS